VAHEDPHRAQKSAEVGGGDPGTPATVLVGIVGAILVFVVIVGLQALFYNAETQTVSQVDQGNPRQLSRLRAEQLEAINSYAWKDREQKVVTIPIDRAMELTVEALAGGRPPVAKETGER
jgi:hypothetical protein